MYYDPEMKESSKVGKFKQGIPTKFNGKILKMYSNEKLAVFDGKWGSISRGSIYIEGKLFYEGGFNNLDADGNGTFYFELENGTTYDAVGLFRAGLPVFYMGYFRIKDMEYNGTWRYKGNGTIKKPDDFLFEGDINMMMPFTGTIVTSDGAISVISQN